MKSARVVALVVLVLTFIFNEWAFRFIFPLEPIDSFLRLMTLVLDVFVLAFVVSFCWQNQDFGQRLRELLDHHSKKLLLYIGFFLGYCLLMSVEFGCRYYFKHLYKAPYTERTYWNPSAVVQDSILGSALPKDSVVTHSYVVNDSLIYKQYYHTDESGRRINPPSHSDSSYNQFIMVTGCSFAFGYGLPEEQTLSFYLDSITGMRAYNYGVAGHGTQQTLAMLESRNLKEELAEPNGVLIHLFIDDHMARLLGSRRLIKLWARNFPYYYLDGEELKHDGSFWTGRHVLSRFYRAISESAFIDLFDIDFPWYTSNNHINLLGAVLEKSKEEFLIQYPEGRFLVVIGPNSKLAPRVVMELRQRNIDVLDLSKLLDKEKTQYKIHWTEGHPNAKYYLEVAEQIDEYLNP